MNLFSTKTVDTVLSAFTKAVAELREVQEIHQAKADNAQIERNAQEAMRVAAQKETDRAKLLEQKLSSFLEA